jgi:hypothetical protein
MIARASGFSDRRILPADAETLRWAAPRPAFSPLSSERAVLLPPLDDALDRHVAILRASGEPAAPPSVDTRPLASDLYS